MRISDWSSDVCSSDLLDGRGRHPRRRLCPDPEGRSPRASSRTVPAAAASISVCATGACRASATGVARSRRSEEHTSELQSLMRISYAVFCLKKKKEPSQSPIYYLLLHQDPHVSENRSSQQQHAIDITASHAQN